MDNITMLAKDALSAKMAECYVTIEGNRYKMMNAINIEATLEKTKQEVPILGRMNKGHKATGTNGTGSASFHYNTSMFRKLMKRYQDTEEDFYFDMQITNEDATSAAGRQTIILKDCNFDSVTVVKFDAGSEDSLTEELDFTFEKFEMPEEFKILEGMQA